MKHLIFMALMMTVAFSPVAFSKDKGKDSLLEEIVRDAIDDDDHPGGGKGRPDNPGEHGRDNAADKQRNNPGKGSKGGDSWEDEIRKAIEGDDNDKGKKGKNKNKKK